MDQGTQHGTASTPPSPQEPAPKPSALDSAKKYWWVAAIIVPVLVALIGRFPQFGSGGGGGGSTTVTQDSHDLHLTNITLIEGEYKSKTGHDLPADVRQRLQQAQSLIEQRKYDEGIPILRQTAESLQLPSAYGELGTALAMAGNRSEAESALQKASSADPKNAAVAEARRFFDSATSNNTILSAKKIALGETINSTLFDADSDFFQFVAPAGPRDLMRLQLKNLSTTLHPRVTIFDAEKSKIDGTGKPDAADIEMTFAAKPSSTIYVGVEPNYSAGGIYSLKIEPTKSFDEFEPNDAITEARQVSVGRTLELNILDAQDIDFFSFQAKAAKTTISLQNKSTTLHPYLAVFDAQKSRVDQKGSTDAADLKFDVASTPGATYYVQVSPNYSAGGKYALTIQ